MIDLPTQALLQETLRRENRSLLQYVNESFPWTAPDHETAINRLRQLAQEQQQETSRIGQFLLRHHVPLPYMGSFPTDFTTINFIGLDYALRRIVQDERRACARLERDRDRIGDPEARALLQDLLERKQRHLQELEALGCGLPATTLR